MTAEFGLRLARVLSSTPGRIEILPFTPDMNVTAAQLDTLEAAYYSRDVWEGTVQSAMSPAARAFWDIVDRASNLKWLSVFSSGSDHGTISRTCSAACA